MVASDGAAGYTDAELIERSLVDREAFVGVFDRHFSVIHRYLRVRVGEVEADDLAAETFEIAFRRRPSFDTLRADARPWLFGIATRLVKEHRRRHRRADVALRRLVARGDVGGVVDDAASDQVHELRTALASVREEDRDLLFLVACVGLSYEECAAALGLPVGTVRSRLSRARARLRDQLVHTLEAGVIG